MDGNVDVVLVVVVIIIITVVELYAVVVAVEVLMLGGKWFKWQLELLYMYPLSFCYTSMSSLPNPGYQGMALLKGILV